MKKLIIIVFLLSSFQSISQTQPILDEIVAVVGNHIILRSDLEAEYTQAKTEMSFYDGDLKCEISTN